LAVDKLISRGTPRVGGMYHRLSAPIAENPNPERPLIRPERARMAQIGINVCSE
jgi:hypothetical protein